MTISASSIDQCRVMRAHWEQVNRRQFDQLPIGATFQTVRRRGWYLEGVFVKVGADTVVTEQGILRLPGEAGVYLPDVQLRVVSVPEDVERFDGLG